jgi:hypothetical protein
MLIYPDDNSLGRPVDVFGAQIVTGSVALDYVRTTTVPITSSVPASYQVVATRMDDSAMTSFGVPFYNASLNRFDTDSKIRFTGSVLKLDSSARLGFDSSTTAGRIQFSSTHGINDGITFDTSNRSMRIVMSGSTAYLTRGGTFTDGILIDNSGNVNIPNSRLDVDNIRIDGNTISSTNSNGDITLSPNGIGIVDINKNLTVSGSTTLSASSHVIYGTLAVVNPTANAYNQNLRLVAANDGYSVIHMGGTVGALSNTANGQWSILRFPDANNNRFSIRHNATDILSILTSSFVGINTTTPTFTLDVNGTFRASTSVSSSLLDIDNLRLDANTISSTNSNGNILLAPNGTGMVGINQPSPLARLHVRESTLLGLTASNSQIIARFEGNVSNRNVFDITQRRIATTANND